MTPAPNLLGNPCRTMAGRRMEPIATTVAGLEPDTAANSAHAITPARARPPYQWPTMVVAKVIMRGGRRAPTSEQLFRWFREWAAGGVFQRVGF